MLEIIYDASLLKLDVTEDTPFFGGTINKYCNHSISDFSTVHPSWTGELFVMQGARAGHLSWGSAPQGSATRATCNCFEFIIPVTSEVEKYIEKLNGADGIYLQGHFFETVRTYRTPHNFVAGIGSFHVPPNHFYFLGVKS